MFAPPQAWLISQDLLLPFSSLSFVLASRLLSKSSWSVGNDGGCFFMKLGLKEVWPLPKFFVFASCKSWSMQLLEGKSMTLYWGEYCSFSFLLVTPLSRSGTLEEPFEQTWHPSRALILALFSGSTEIQGHWHVLHSRQRGSRTPSIPIHTTLYCVSVKCTLFHNYLWLQMGNWIQLSEWLDLGLKSSAVSAMVSCTLNKFLLKSPTELITMSVGVFGTS